jgi:hypothetical protein
MLHATEQMIRELYEWSERPHDGRDMLALVLGPQGWSTEVATSGAGLGADDPSVVLTADAVSDTVNEDPWAEAEGRESGYTTDVGAAMAEEYRIPHASGEVAQPGPGIKWVVVTGTYTGAADDEGESEERQRPWAQRQFDRSWQAARWIDLGLCREIVTEKNTFGQAEPERDVSLWTTPDGTGYLLRLHSRYAGELEHEWIWCHPQDAAQIAYDADADQVVTEKLSAAPLLEAVRAARTAIDALDSPHLTAAQRVEAARVLSDLLRGRSVPDVRAARSRAAREVLADHDGDRDGACDELGMAYSTFSNLIA